MESIIMTIESFWPVEHPSADAALPPAVQGAVSIPDYARPVSSQRFPVNLSLGRWFRLRLPAKGDEGNDEQPTEKMTFSAETV
jgi:hypothetical protein